MATTEATTAETVQVSESVADWAAMPAADQQAYVDKLHSDFKAEKAEDAERNGKQPESHDEPPLPGRTRDEMRPRDDSGRFSKAEKKQDESPAVNDETPVDDDAAPAAKPDKAKGGDRDWLDADTKDLATQYGISDEKLAKIPSREVLDILLESIDTKAFEAGKAKAAPPQTQESSTAPTEDVIAALEKINLGEQLGAEDAATIQKFFSGSVSEIKQLKSRFSALEQQIQYRERQELVNRLEGEFSKSFDEVAKKSGIEDFLKKPENLERVKAAHMEHLSGLVAMGKAKWDRNLKITPWMIQTAVNQQFAEELTNQAKQKHLDELKQQSNKRRGGGSTVPLKLPPNATPLEQNLAALGRNKRILTGADV